MGKLIYALNVSLDGYVETSDHAIDWANVDDELHAWFNDLARGTPFFPQLETPIRLRLTETRRFESGVTYLSYAAA
jgi:dihydrofolate reductase